MTKTKRLYSLFEKQNGKWVRISNYSYTKSSAVKIYQNALLAYAMGECNNERSLRPV